MLKKYNITVNGVLYQVEVEEIKGDFENQSIEEKINSKKHVEENVLKKEEVDNSNLTLVQGEKVECPMSGIILSVNVDKNQYVKKGQVLCILESMKMENEIVAPKEGRVLQGNVAKGMTVNTGDILFVID